MYMEVMYVCDVMYVCMFVMYVCMHAGMYVCMYVCMYVGMYVCVRRNFCPMPAPGGKQGEMATGEPQRMAQLEGQNDQETETVFEEHSDDELQPSPGWLVLAPAVAGYSLGEPEVEPEETHEEVVARWGRLVRVYLRLDFRRRRWNLECGWLRGIRARGAPWAAPPKGAEAAARRW